MIRQIFIMGVSMTNTLSAGKDDFYRQMVKLTIPIIIQNLLSAAVNSADVIMLNYVGQSAISAVSLAANFYCDLGDRGTDRIYCSSAYDEDFHF